MGAIRKESDWMLACWSDVGGYRVRYELASGRDLAFTRAFTSEFWSLWVVIRKHVDAWRGHCGC